jgi:hypothetical protein
MIETVRSDKNSWCRKEPAMARLLRAWEVLAPYQKEDLVYLAQSMANRNRREGREIQLRAPQLQSR